TGLCRFFPSRIHLGRERGRRIGKWLRRERRSASLNVQSPCTYNHTDDRCVLGIDVLRGDNRCRTLEPHCRLETSSATIEFLAWPEPEVWAWCIAPWISS